MAETFASEPAVLGYETMNEPFAGDVYADPALLLPGVAGRKNLARLHEACAAAIREKDTRHVPCPAASLACFPGPRPRVHGVASTTQRACVDLPSMQSAPSRQCLIMVAR